MGAICMAPSSTIYLMNISTKSRTIDLPYIRRSITIMIPPSSLHVGALVSRSLALRAEASTALDSYGVHRGE